MTDRRHCGTTLSEDAQVCSDCGTGVPSAVTASPAPPEHEWAVVNGPAWLLARQRAPLGRAKADGEVEAPGPGLGARIGVRIVLVIVLVALAVLMVLAILLLKAFV
jgi:hypothetical protein